MFWPNQYLSLKNDIQCTIVFVFNFYNNKTAAVKINWGPVRTDAFSFENAWVWMGSSFVLICELRLSDSFIWQRIHKGRQWFRRQVEDYHAFMPSLSSKERWTKTPLGARPHKTKINEWTKWKSRPYKCWFATLEKAFRRSHLSALQHQQSNVKINRTCFDVTGVVKH